MRKSTLLITVAAASLGLSTSAILVAQPAETPASGNAAGPATPADPATGTAATPATPATPAAKADDPLAPTADEVKAEKSNAAAKKKKAVKKAE